MTTGWGDVDVAQAEPAHVNASEDLSEPLGEAPELSMPQTVSLIDRQAQALGEIRVWAEQRQLVCDDMRSMYAAGLLTAARDMLAILDRLGLT